MAEIYTFSKNEWIPVQVPSGLEAQEMFFAFSYTLLVREKGIDAKRALVIAEAAAMKRLYPGLMYGSLLEKELEILRDG
jgi:predicted metal-binding protein